MEAAEKSKFLTFTPYPAPCQSELAMQRSKDEIVVPQIMQSKNFTLNVLKQFQATSFITEDKIKEQFPLASTNDSSKFFAEVIRSEESPKVDLIDEHLRAMEERCQKFNPHASKQKIGVLHLGRSAPGTQNVIDGLLRFRKARTNIKIIGFRNGREGFLNKDWFEIKEENYKNFRNLGGLEFLGRSEEKFRGEETMEKARKICEELELTGLVLTGATNTLTDAVDLAEYFMAKSCRTNIVVAPASIDGDINPKFIESAIGFDTATKVFSQLAGNMLTDSASALKYWYFIRIMGGDPSNTVIEVALQTHPNYTVISEEILHRKQTIDDVVKKIADTICVRDKAGKNFGAILIPEGLLNYLPSFRTLFDEINKLFEGKDSHEIFELAMKMTVDDDYLKSLITPWSYQVYQNLPKTIQVQVINDRALQGPFRVSQIETEKLLAHLVGIELEKRKKSGEYKSSFGPVCHYFGYQGRTAMPTTFDCSLGTAVGFGAGCLIEQRFSGHVVSIRNTTLPAENWRIGGVPILALLESAPKLGFGYRKLVVPANEVDLNGPIYQKFKQLQRYWEVVDHYSNPGPT